MINHHRLFMIKPINKKKKVNEMIELDQKGIIQNENHQNHYNH